MIVVKIMGGIGNQMFQYALGRHLSIKNNTELRLDLSSFDDMDHRPFKLDKFNTKILKAEENTIPYPVKSRKLNRYRIFLYKIFGSKLKLRSEEQFHFDREVLNYKNNNYLRGYWQSEKYFTDAKDRILEDFTFSSPIDPKFNDVVDLISKCESVSLHIRRGDYLKNPFHKTLALDYYHNAIALIKKKTQNPVLFIFSDDIKWCKENMNLNLNHHFISNNEDWEDLYLMTLCKHNIIANSTFSWWGAYLGINENKKVVAPKDWNSEKRNYNTSDILLNHWYTL